MSNIRDMMTIINDQSQEIRELNKSNSNLMLLLLVSIAVNVGFALVLWALLVSL